MSEAEAAFEEQTTLVNVTTSPLVRAVLGTAPFTGGLASLLGDLTSRRQEIRLRRFLISLAAFVEQQQDTIVAKLDQDVLDSDQFASVVETVMQEAARSADEQKLSMLRRFLIGSTFRDRPDARWQDLFLKYVRDLSGIHLVILAFVFRKEASVAEGDRFGGVRIPGIVPVSVIDIVESGPLLDADLVAVACSDLASAALLVDWASISGSEAKLQREYVISPSGERLMRFLEGDWNIGRQG